MNIEYLTLEYNMCSTNTAWLCDMWSSTNLHFAF